MTRPGVTHISVERGAGGAFVDPGEWEGTHWHLTRSEFRTADRERFSAARVERSRHAAPERAARTPQEVVAWMREQAPKGDYADELTFWRASRGQDCHRLRRLGATRIAHLDAYATTRRCCGTGPQL